jgi:alkanesulfonate monooxygenase SsuD/methylene tetrahydromethanopterin reductase-like flavin-dependent oxidoreductase (luciferase family)
MLPLFGSPSRPILEGWTLLAALTAQTERLRMGLLATSNRVRPPAVLAKIAATTDVISRGRLIMGIGVGGTHQAAGAGGVSGDNPAIAEYAAYGPTLIPPAGGVVAEHADIWNTPGPQHNTAHYIGQRSRVLDEHCAVIGRDPREIIRSTQTDISYEDPAHTRAVIESVPTT